MGLARSVEKRGTVFVLLGFILYRIFARRLTIFDRPEVVGVAHAAAIDEGQALSRRLVEVKTRNSCTAQSLVRRKLAYFFPLCGNGSNDEKNEEALHGG